MSRATGRTDLLSVGDDARWRALALVLATLVAAFTMATAGASVGGAFVGSLTTRLAAPALATSSGVLAWGGGGAGQLGNSTTRSSNTPVAVSGLSGVTSVAGGGEHSLALRGDGTVVAWGSNQDGQLGDGSSTGPEECEFRKPCSDIPVPVSGLDGVTAIAAGSEHSLALLSNGTVMAWGNNGSGELGSPGEDSDVPVPVSGLSGVTAIAAGDDFSLALLSNGTVMAWGSNYNGQLGDSQRGYETNSDVPVPVSGLSGVTAIAAGGGHSLALLRDGTVMAWGYNYWGELGDGTNTGPESCGFVSACSDKPVPVSGLSGVTSVAAGNSHSLALLGNGTVKAWGTNEAGTLGDGIHNPDTCGAGAPCSNTPVPVSGLSSVTAIAAGYEHSLALLSNGTLMDWGQAGTLGNGTDTAPEICRFGESCSSTPLPVSGLTGVTAIAAGAGHSLAVSAISTITKVEPNSGPFVGGTSVSIAGTNFIGVTAVKFGSANATKFIVHSPTSITAVSPAGSGTVRVTVVTPVGASITARAGYFSYEPTVTRVEPSAGRVPGGTSVAIRGSNLMGATAVKFGSADATKFKVQSASSVTAVSPPGAGTVYVTVATPGGTSAVGGTDQFTYLTPDEWRISASVHAGTGNSSLNGVSCLMADRCIAVGTSGPSYEEKALIESWNGSLWSIVPTPSLPETRSSLNGVSCAPAKFCMAVGASRPECPCAHPPVSTFIETWNGSRWSIASSPDIRDDFLTGVSCVSSRFCVAVGFAYANGGGPASTLVESWNGTEWSIVPSPSRFNSSLEAVSCVSIKVCVAVGGDLVESWNGTEWSIVPSPSTGSLRGISCTSVEHCVAVGGSASGTLIETWNGSTWSVLESPNPKGSRSPQLNAVSCISARSCAAVGSDSTEEGSSQTLVEASKGSTWSIVPSANGASGVSHLDGVSCVSTESCFAVGEDEATPEGASQTLVESGRVQSLGGFGFSRF
jgi:alpha-tubulin suppressor-like RCC1 family protein